MATITGWLPRTHPDYGRPCDFADPHYGDPCGKPAVYRLVGTGDMTWGLACVDHVGEAEQAGFPTWDDEDEDEPNS